MKFNGAYRMLRRSKSWRVAYSLQQRIDRHGFSILESPRISVIANNYETYLADKSSGAIRKAEIREIRDTRFAM